MRLLPSVDSRVNCQRRLLNEGFLARWTLMRPIAGMDPSYRSQPEHHTQENRGLGTVPDEITASRKALSTYGAFVLSIGSRSLGARVAIVLVGVSGLIALSEAVAVRIEGSMVLR